jgi:GxxExxY protein
MNTDERGFASLAEQVLGAVFEVSNTLGSGFLEKVYERALLRELCIRGIRAKAQASFTITYKGHCVGEYCADILVEGALVVELKCVDRLSGEHTAQCLITCARRGWPCVFWSISSGPKWNGNESSTDFSLTRRRCRDRRKFPAC